MEATPDLELVTQNGEKTRLVELDVGVPNDGSELAVDVVQIASDESISQDEGVLEIRFGIFFISSLIH